MPKIQENTKQFNEWIAKYGEIYEIEIPLDESYSEFIKFIARKPNAYHLNEFIKKMDKYPIDANYLLVNSCWLDGDERVKQDDYINAAARELAQQVIGGDAIAIKFTKDNYAGFAPEKVNAWLAQYGDVYFLKVPKDTSYEDFYTCVVRKAVRQVMNRYLSQADRVPINASKELLRAIWIEGDEVIKEDVKYVISCISAINQMVIGLQATLKKISPSNSN